VHIKSAFTHTHSDCVYVLERERHAVIGRVFVIDRFAPGFRSFFRSFVGCVLDLSVAAPLQSRAEHGACTHAHVSSREEPIRRLEKEREKEGGREESGCWEKKKKEEKKRREEGRKHGGALQEAGVKSGRWKNKGDARGWCLIHTREKRPSRLRRLLRTHTNLFNDRPSSTSLFFSSLYPSSFLFTTEGSSSSSNAIKVVSVKFKNV